MKQSSTLSLRQLTTLTGVSRQAIDAHVRSGVIIRVDRNRYAARSVPNYCAHLRKIASEGGGASPERAELLRERILMARFEREVARRKFVPADQVESVWMRAVAVFRQRMLAMPAKLADRVCKTKSPAEAMELLRLEIRNALQELAAIEYAAEDGSGNDDGGNGNGSNGRTEEGDNDAVATA
jgi:hypothetical protein